VINATAASAAGPGPAVPAARLTATAFLCQDGRVLVIGRILRACVVGCAVAVAAACGAGDDAPEPGPVGPVLDPGTVQAALLEPAEIGPTWKVPADPVAPGGLVSFCGGDTAAPAAPAGATPVASAAVDEGTRGAQTLHQTALVYPDTAAAAGALAALRRVADGCPPSVDAPAKTGEDRKEPAYTETARTAPLTEGEWTGFVVERHKRYEPTHPGTADTAVAVLARGNVVLVDSYAIYRLGAASTSPQFSADWQKLVGTVLNRLNG
jgi:hypothetical protein